MDYVLLGQCGLCFSLLVQCELCCFLLGQCGLFVLLWAVSSLNFSHVLYSFIGVIMLGSNLISIDCD